MRSSYSCSRFSTAQVLVVLAAPAREAPQELVARDLEVQHHELPGHRTRELLQGLRLGQRAREAVEDVAPGAVGSFTRSVIMFTSRWSGTSSPFSR